MTADMLPVVARVLPPSCNYSGCQHHYYPPRRQLGWTGEPLIEGCICVAWPAARGSVHLVAVNPLCQAHHTVLDIIYAAANILCWHGYLDPENDELPAEDITELLDIYRAGPCERFCVWFDLPQAIADHWVGRRRDEYRAPPQSGTARAAPGTSARPGGATPRSSTT
jgi:hypothetical protein